MLSFCLKCKENGEGKNLEVLKTKYKKIMLLPRFAVCGNEKSKFIKDQEASGLLSKLGIRTLLSKIPLLGDILF